MSESDYPVKNLYIDSIVDETHVHRHVRLTEQAANKLWKLLKSSGGAKSSTMLTVSQWRNIVGLQQNGAWEHYGYYPPNSDEPCTLLFKQPLRNGQASQWPGAPPASPPAAEAAPPEKPVEVKKQPLAREAAHPPAAEAAEPPKAVEQKPAAPSLEETSAAGEPYCNDV